MSKLVLLAKVARVLGWHSCDEWPDAMTIEELATLEATDGNMQTNKELQTVLLAVMRKAIKSRRFSAGGTRMVLESPPKDASIESLMRFYLRPPGYYAIQVVSREEYFAWEDRPNSPSLYISDWLENQKCTVDLQSNINQSEKRGRKKRESTEFKEGLITIWMEWPKDKPKPNVNVLVKKGIKKGYADEYEEDTGTIIFKSGRGIKLKTVQNWLSSDPNFR